MAQTPGVAGRKASDRAGSIWEGDMKARLQDLLHEARLLLLAFPHLRDAFDKDELPIAFVLAKGSGRLTKRSNARRHGARGER